MGMNRKKVVWGIVVGVAVVAIFVWIFAATSSKEYQGEVENMSELPFVHSLIDTIPTKGPVRYILIDAHRGYLLWVVADVPQDAMEKWLAMNPEVTISKAIGKAGLRTDDLERLSRLGIQPGDWEGKEWWDFWKEEKVCHNRSPVRSLDSSYNPSAEQFIVYIEVSKESLKGEWPQLKGGRYLLFN